MRSHSVALTSTLFVTTTICIKFLLCFRVFLVNDEMCLSWFLVSQMGFLEFLVSWVFLLCFYLSLCVCVLYKFMYFVCFYLSVSWVVVIA